MRSGFLEGVLARKREELRRRKERIPEAELERFSVPRPALRLTDALSPPGGLLRIIAELKRASPSAGRIAELDAAAQARTYARGGAAAVSVLTDGAGFGGSLEDLASVRGACGLPLLRKDFILDRYQLVEACAHGADAALLIVAALEPGALRELIAAAAELGLDALVEVHGEQELDAALEAGARIVGINNRDLRTFEVDLATTERLAPRIPEDVPFVAESGIRSRADVVRLRRAGASNFLIGEALVRAPDAAALLAELRGAR